MSINSIATTHEHMSTQHLLINFHDDLFLIRQTESTVSKDEMLGSANSPPENPFPSREEVIPSQDALQLRWSRESEEGEGNEGFIVENFNEMVAPPIFGFCFFILSRIKFKECLSLSFLLTTFSSLLVEGINWNKEEGVHLRYIVFVTETWWR